MIRATSALVAPTRTIDAIKDEPDNRFLECADAARADYLITGNKQHFPKQFENIRVVTQSSFWKSSGRSFWIDPDVARANPNLID